MKKTVTHYMVLLMSLTLIFHSCDKQEETVSITEVAAADDEASAYFDEVLAESDEVTFSSMLKSDEIAAEGMSGTRSVTTTFSGDTVIHTIVFTDFVNAHSPNSRVKNGTVIIKMTGRPHMATFTRQISMENFTIDGNLVEGVKVIRKTSATSFEIILENGKITFSDGTTYTRDFTRTRTQTSGMDTPFNIWDDEFNTEGSSSGINRQGNRYTHAITSALVTRRNCRWIVQGVITITVGEQTAQVDYGSGECDSIATISVNGNTREIDLRNGR